MNFKEWDEIIKNNKYSMLFFEIYYNLTCYDKIKVEDLKDDEKTKIIYSIYDAYLKDEQHADLGFICDIALENIDNILNDDDFTKWDLLNKCYERM